MEFYVETISKAFKDIIPGGKADKKKPSDFDPKQIKEGMKVEREHTNNPKIAKEIVLDHFSEFPPKIAKKYYPELKKLEKKLKAKKSFELVIDLEKI